MSIGTETLSRSKTQPGLKVWLSDRELANSQLLKNKQKKESILFMMSLALYDLY
jgi:hypothetical protein